MAERELHTVLQSLKSSTDYQTSSSLLSKAKLLLLKLNALTPSRSTPQPLLLAARSVFELGALTSIRARDPDSFTRYVAHLQPFYDLPSSTLSPENSERNKITGLFLLLLLVKGDYAGFHTELEGLEMRGVGEVEDDRYLGYPIRLERWLMEGAYDQVWKAMRRGEVPSEEFGVFSEVSYSRSSFTSSDPIPSSHPLYRADKHGK
jgi:26S proteasome regulatory subunit N12